MGCVVIRDRRRIQGKRLLALLLGLVIFLGSAGTLIPESVQAKEKRTVKVAFFPMDGYHIKTGEDSYDGVDVQYLKALCEYANWEIAYVECKSWDDALALSLIHI